MPETGLQGKKILLTRPLQQSGAWAESLKSEGAIPFIFPLIEINKAEPDSLVLKAIEELASYDGILFSSVNGASYFLDLLNKEQKKVLNTKIIAVVGKATMEYLEANGIQVTFIPDQYTAEEMANQIPDVSDKKYLLPTTSTAKETLSERLKTRGAEVDIIFVYTNSPVKEGSTELNNILNKGIDVISFASPSAIEGYTNLMGYLAPAYTIACIGPVTAAKAEQLGWKVNIIANTHTAEGLSDAVKTYYNYDKQTQKA